jgi:hypothetical protein
VTMAGKVAVIVSVSVMSFAAVVMTIMVVTFAVGPSILTLSCELTVLYFIVNWGSGQNSAR